VGDPRDVFISIESIQTTVLLDTGCTVSTMTASFNEKYMSDHPIRQIEEILNLKCAYDSVLPYEGCVKVKMQSEGLKNDREHTRLFLIVEDTDYHSTVSFLLGTIS
jgi:hypothetical protein